MERMVRATMTRTQSVKVMFQSRFSSTAGTETRAVYLGMCVLVLLYTLVALGDGLIDTCAYARNRLSDDDDIVYKNPEFRTLGKCLESRPWFLLGLSPLECMMCRRILVASVLGMMIGFERRRADRPAGIRTMSLVALGSCIFTIDSMFAFSSSPDSWDASRVAAAIPSGVGFLGAGLIYKHAPKDAHDMHEVHGLTTASSVWLSAAVGIAAGGGLFLVSFFAAMTMILILRFGPRLPNDHAQRSFVDADCEADPLSVRDDEAKDAQAETARLTSSDSAQYSTISDSSGRYLPRKASLHE